MEKIKGTGVALVSPFNEDLSIDYLVEQEVEVKKGLI